MFDFLSMAEQCAPVVHPTTMAAVAKVESGFNQFAIGVVGGRLDRQPVSKDEAVRTARMLEDAGYNFSVGVSQVNRYNLKRYQLDYAKAFEPCDNLRVGSLILKDCYDRARIRLVHEQEALHAAFSCYYSGNFSAGFKPEARGQPSYVQKVLAGAADRSTASIGPAQFPPVAIHRVKSKDSSSAAFHMTADRDATSTSAGYVGRRQSTMVFQQ